MDLRTSERSAIHETKQFPYVIETKSKFPASFDEGEAFHVFIVIKPVPPIAAGWLWHDTDTFVIANGLDVYPGKPG